jgi:hypothetical protein
VFRRCGWRCSDECPRLRIGCESLVEGQIVVSVYFDNDRVRFRLAKEERELVRVCMSSTSAR